ncbi:MAG: serine hydrolase domain-containing protein [Chitinophagales bacterium]
MLKFNQCPSVVPVGVGLTLKSTFSILFLNLLIACCLLMSSFSVEASNKSNTSKKQKKSKKERNQQQQVTLSDYVEELVNRYAEQDETYGIAVGIIYDNKAYQFGYGQISDQDPMPPSAQTLFHLGSLSKVFTTAVFSGLVQDAILAPNAPITQYLPDSVVQANPFLAQITLQQLATHTSGLPKEPYNIALTLVDKDNPYANYTIKDVYGFLMHYKPRDMGKKWYRKGKQKPKAAVSEEQNIHFRYSHFGVGLLGHLLENATQTPYDELLSKYVRQPLAIPDLHSQMPMDNQKQLAPGHYFSGKTANRLHYASLEGSEGLRSSLEGVLRFTYANMLPYLGEDAPVLNSKKTVDKEAMVKALAKCHEPKAATNMQFVSVGLGWYIINQGSKKNPTSIITHSGRTGGYSNYIAFEKEKGVGVVILSNSASRIDQLGIDILEVLLANKRAEE